MNRNPKDRIATGAQASKTVRWMVGIGVTILFIIGLVLLILLTQATSNRALYDRNYDRLYWINTAVALLLLAGLLWGLTRLIIRLRQGQFGSRLLVKLAAIFALVGVVPGVLIYVVSYQFVSRSIESWFDVKVEGALVAGLPPWTLCRAIWPNNLAWRPSSWWMCKRPLPHSH
jgi:nitrogen fixation/metabolism regulation signal transduction histidine kinase